MSIASVRSYAPSTASSGTNASNSSGLAFSGGFATLNGQPIALSDIIDDKTGRFTEAQQDQANETLQAREKAAYGQYIGTGTQDGNKKFVEAYIQYVQSLPPDEQNSQRYRDTLQAAQGLLDEINNTSSSSTSSSDQTDSSTDPKAAALKILTGSLAAQQKAKDHHKRSGHSGNFPTDTITLSSAARQAILSQTS